MVDRYVEQKFVIDCFHTAFRFSYGEDFVFRGERHDFWEATLVTSGVIIMTQDENVYEMGAGNMILHAPGEFHRLQSGGDTRPTGYTVAFHTQGELPRELSECFFKLDRDEIAEYEAIMERLIPYVNEGRDGFCGQYAASLLSCFLIKLSDNASASVKVSGASAEEYNKVVSDMQNCIYEGYDLCEFAKRSSISLSYLKLLFTKYAGVSPKSYYSTLRANEAARLLRLGNSVFDTAEQMHFSSPNYFSVFFKRHFGISPKKYK